MKAKLITIHGIYNYGSILQASATLAVLRRLGVDAELVDYKYPNEAHVRGGASRQSVRSRLLSRANGLLKGLLPRNPQRVYVRRYAEFAAAHLALTRPYASFEELCADPPAADVHIVGSDQVWRPEFTLGDPSFFLRYAQGRRIAYASSFGCREIEPPHRDRYAEFLSDMDAIGVREVSGARLVEELTGRRATVVLDPTLMLDAAEWRRFENSRWPGMPERPYVLCYGLDLSGGLNVALAREVARESGLDVVHVGGKAYHYFRRRVRYLLDVGPAEWLHLMRNAAFVVASSFHGTAFAINFGRPFVSVLRGDRDHDARQAHILAELGLAHRAVLPGNGARTLLRDLPSADYANAHARLDLLRTRSADFLRRALFPEAG